MPPAVIRTADKTLVSQHNITTFFFAKEGSSVAEVTFDKDCYSLNESIGV